MFEVFEHYECNGQIDINEYLKGRKHEETKQDILEHGKQKLFENRENQTDVVMDGRKDGC